MKEADLSGNQPGDAGDSAELRLDCRDVLLFEGSQVVMLLIDPADGRIVDANRAAVLFYGWSREELRRKKISDINILSHEQVREEMAAALAMERNIFLFRHRLADGSVRDVEVHCGPICHEGREYLHSIIHDVTARRVAEEELRRNKALMEIAGRMSKLGGWEVSLPDLQVRWSDAVFEMLELPQGEGSPFLEAVSCNSPESLKTLDVAMRKCMADGTPFDLELQIRTNSGRWLDVRCCGEADRDAQGRIVRIHGAFQDITDRKTAEKLTRLRITALRAAANAIVITNRDGIIEWCNQAFSTITGYGRKEATGKRPGELLKSGQHDAAFYRDMWETVIAGRVWHGDVVNRRKDGSLYNEEMTITPVRDPGGEITHFIAVKQDVTEKRQLHAKLLENEERFRYVSMVIVDVVYDWDLVADSIWWDDSIVQILGGEPHELQQNLKEWVERIHPDERDAVIEGWDRFLAGSDLERVSRYRVRRMDGTYAHVNDHCMVIRDVGNKAIRVVGGVTDITSHLALEEQLRQSQRLDSVGQLTGGVAHDFNNLLTVIMGNAELLVDELEELPEQRSLAETVMQAAKTGAELTHRLLAFARRQALEPRSIDPNELLTGMDHLLRRTIGEHIELEIIYGADLWKTLVDPAQLESAVLNLCINARDAMPGGGRLTIETSNSYLNEDYAQQHAEVQAGQYVMVAISDTGEGIAPEHLAKVFEPFYTTKEPGKGTGLGLSMVYGFVKQSHGHIMIYSEPGEGTTVKLYLPRLMGEWEAREDEHECGVMPGGDEVILLVEDDELVRRYAMGQLAALGYTVLEAGNGPSAMEIIRVRDDIDLLFTDAVMPGGMSGRQLADAAKAVRPLLKVLYTSGYTSDAIVHQGRLDSGAQVLGKPYGRMQLARKVREVLDEKSL